MAFGAEEENGEHASRGEHQKESQNDSEFDEAKPGRVHFPFSLSAATALIPTRKIIREKGVQASVGHVALFLNGDRR